MLGPWRTSLVLLVTTCAAAAVGVAAAAGGARGEANGWCQWIRAPPALQYPRDLSAHPAQENEYWWILGNARSTKEPFTRFGVTMLMFRADALHDCLSLNTSIVQVAIAISDPRTGNFYRFQSLVGASAMQISSIDDPDVPFRLESSVAGMHELFGKAGSFQIWGNGTDQSPYKPGMPFGFDFQAATNPSLVDQGFIAIGDNGYVATVPGYGSGNIGLTTLPATGSLSLGGENIDVTADFYIDHAWWTTPPSSVSTSKGGWDWYAIQLSNGVRAAFALFLTDDLKVSNFSSGVVLREGANPYATRLELSQWIITTEQPWMSPNTNIAYDQLVHIQVPSLSLDVHVRALVADNENMSYEAGAAFEYEAAADVTGTDRGTAVTGVGWVEHKRKI